MRLFGLFLVIERFDQVAYKLVLPSSTWKHHVFYSSRL